MQRKKKTELNPKKNHKTFLFKNYFIGKNLLINKFNFFLKKSIKNIWIVKKVVLHLSSDFVRGDDRR